MTVYDAHDLEREGMINARLLIVFVPLWIAEAVAACFIAAAHGWVI